MIKLFLCLLELCYIKFLMELYGCQRNFHLKIFIIYIFHIHFHTQKVYGNVMSLIFLLFIIYLFDLFIICIFHIHFHTKKVHGNVMCLIFSSNILHYFSILFLLIFSSKAYSVLWSFSANCTTFSKILFPFPSHPFFILSVLNPLIILCSVLILLDVYNSTEIQSTSGKILWEKNWLSCFRHLWSPYLRVEHCVHIPFKFRFYYWQVIILTFRIHSWMRMMITYPLH